MRMLQSLFYLTIALHVSGIIITHLQEHKITVIIYIINNCNFNLVYQYSLTVKI